MPWALMLFAVNPVRAPRVGPAPHMGRGSPLRVLLPKRAAGESRR